MVRCECGAWASRRPCAHCRRETGDAPDRDEARRRRLASLMQSPHHRVPKRVLRKLGMSTKYVTPEPVEPPKKGHRQ